MNEIGRKSLRVTGYQFRQQFLTVKTLVTAALLFVYINRLLRPVADFSRSAGIGVYPWFLPILTSDYRCQIFLVSGGIFLFSNAPFTNANESCLRYRSGSFCWILGNVWYMLAASFLYVAGILAMGMVNLADVLDFGSSWGKIWGALARTDAEDIFRVPFSVGLTVLKFSPGQALWYSFLLEWLCVFWMGLLIYGCNDQTGKRCGTLAAASKTQEMDLRRAGARAQGGLYGRAQKKEGKR